MAKRNLSAARRNATAGDMQLAGADLVVAGEEIARARVLFAAYEDFVTFDKVRATERYYVSQRRLDREHDLKFSLLCAFSIALNMGLSRFRYREYSDEERKRVAESPDEWIRKTLSESGLMTLTDYWAHLEELRQGRYSGRTTTGTQPPVLDKVTFDRLATAIEEQVTFSEYEITVYKRGPGELEALQGVLPELLRMAEKLVAEIKSQGTGGLPKRV